MTPTHLDILQSFKQDKVNLPDPVGEVGNCASVALIKASIEVLGLGNIFKQTKAGDTYQVTFLSGKQVSFTEKELARSTQVAGLKALKANDPGKQIMYDEIFSCANLCMCAMTKSVMEIGEAGDGIGDFEVALRALNDGANTPNLPYKLGLDDHFLGRKMWRNTSGAGLIGWLKGHTVYISHDVWDDYGTPATNVIRYPFRMQITK